MVTVGVDDKTGLETGPSETLASQGFLMIRRAELSKKKLGRPPEYVDPVRRSWIFERSIINAVKLVAIADGSNQQAVIQKAVREYIERNYPAALQPGTRISATITSDAG